MDLVNQLEINSRKTIFTLVYPVILENIFQTLVLFFNMVMLSHLGTADLAAAGLANTIIFAIINIFLGFQIGATSLIAQAVGGKDFKKAKEILNFAIFFAFIFGLLITLILHPLRKNLMILMGAEREVAIKGGEYLNFIIIFLLFRMLFLINNGILRGYGDTKTPMLISLTFQVLTIILNYFLIFGIFFFPRLGIKGAGLGTGIGGLVSALLSLILIKIKIKEKTEKILNLNYFKDFIKISLPAANEQLLLNLGFLIFIRIVASLGTISLAAHQIAVRVESLSFMPGSAFGIVATTLAGQAFGAKRKDLVDFAIKRTSLYSFLIMSTIGILFFFFPHYFVALFNPESTVRKFAIDLVRIGALEQPQLALCFVYAGGLRGIGDTVSPMLVALLSTFLIRIGLIYFLAIFLKLGIYGVWYGTVIDWTIRAFLLFIFYKRKNLNKPY
ncbi:MAG: MATE family efflux transporter [candidate division WOR-3 bacterium]|nr:MATE family efflux transporter [candidate division WOR-3 bacterium]MDW8114686.1 MATE family efflux transporter [candidate division WOR-3 bacterium]